MYFNLFGSLTKNEISVGYIHPSLGYVDNVSICEANNYAKDNPGTTFIFRDGNNNIRYLNINEVNSLTANDLVSTASTCGGIQEYKECGPPVIQFFGGGGIGAVANPVIGIDGSLLTVDLIRGGYGYQYPPIVKANDHCQYGNGAILTAVLGETVDEIEVYEGEEDFEEYEICEDDDVGYGVRYGPNGEELGPWEPNFYSRIGTDPIKREIEIFQKALEKPFWTTRKYEPDRITTPDEQYPNSYPVTYPSWNEFMNEYAISPVKPSYTKGTDESGKVFSIEWDHNFPITGEYIFRGLCDNQATLYIDNSKVGDLKGFNSSVIPLQKTVIEGVHVIKIDLINVPIYENVEPDPFVDVPITVYGQGKNTEKINFSFTSEDGTHSFVVRGVSVSRENRTEVIRVKPNTNYKVVASTRKRNTVVEQGVIKNDTKNKEGGLDKSNKIFADHLESANDNDDMQITAENGFFTPSNKRKTSLGRTTFDLTFRVESESLNITQKIVSSKSWYENPIGVSMIIEAPPPSIPQEQPPPQIGQCPPNPIWTTRFPGSQQKWYPVRFNRNNSWSRFMNRYAISPILPLNTPGSDVSGVTFSNNWDIDLPYSGYYGVKGTRDNKGRLLIDGKEITTLDSFNVNNPKLTKVYLSKGKHTITVEVLNKPSDNVSIIDTKIFSTKDWRVAGTAVTESPSELKAKFIQRGFSYYLQVDGTGSCKIFFVMDVVNDKSYNAGLAAKQIIIPSDNGKVRFKRTEYEYPIQLGSVSLTSPPDEVIKESGTFSGGNLYGPIEIIGADPLARGPIPIKNGSQKFSLRDADGDDENIQISIKKIEAKSTNSITPISQSKTKNGVIYSGPELSGYTDSRWSNYMNEFSVSPSGGGVGKYTLIWKNVNFPYNGTYKFNFQADNVGLLKIGGREIYKTTDFTGEKVQYIFNTTTGKYDVVIELENIKNPKGNSDNPLGVALYISKDVVVSESNKTPWTDNPIAISAILIPPPCAKKIGGKGVVTEILVDDPGNGYISPEGSGYPVTLVLDKVIVENPGINYSCGEDQIRITPSNGAELSYNCDSFGRINSVNVLNPGIGFNVYPEITIPSDTGVNASFRPVFRVVRDPVQLLEDKQITQEKLIQVTDLVGLKQTGYVDGRAYYGAVYYDQGISYAGYYKTAGTQIRVYDTLQESITARVTTPPSAIQRSGTDIRSNDPRLNIPGTPESTSEQS